MPSSGSPWPSHGRRRRGAASPSTGTRGGGGGGPPLLRSNAEAIEVILEAIGKAGYRPGKEIGIALDAAASEFREKGKYGFRKSDGSKRSADGMVKFYEGLCRQYPIVSVEDGFAEEDWRGWKMFTQAMR